MQVTVKVTVMDILPNIVDVVRCLQVFASSTDKIKIYILK